MEKTFIIGETEKRRGQFASLFVCNGGGQLLAPPPAVVASTRLGGGGGGILLAGGGGGGGGIRIAVAFCNHCNLD